MSEAAPGYPDAPVYATAPRARLAGAVRDLLDALLTTPEATETELAAATAATEQATAVLTGGAAVRTRSGYGDLTHADHLPRSPVVGEANPISPCVDWEIVDGVVHARGTFGAVHEGPPGYVHGGMVALAFDEILGLANVASGHPGMTGTLKVRYRRPTPLFTEVRFVGRVQRVEGRRLLSRGELWADETLCAEAEGIFVQLRPETALDYFGRAPGDG